LSKRDIERGWLFQPSEALRDQRRLLGQHRIVELEVNPDATRFTWCCDAAPCFSGDEGPSSDFPDNEATAQQLGVDAAMPRS
jgi:hypothetical protein